jgi:hypothetical protein
MTQEGRSFDQIVTGDIHIEKLNKYKYRITFRKISNFLLYQVWNKNNEIFNNKRAVGYVSPKKWITQFKKYNKYLEKNKKLSFTPTAIMDMENDMRAFVIRKACLNSLGKIFFIVSTKEISLENNIPKKMIELPNGKYYNVRFDIDNKECPPDSNGIRNDSCNFGF